MSTVIDDLSDLHAYLVPALKRAICHAPNVEDIVPAILGHIILSADPVSVRRRGSGATSSGNMGWWTSEQTGRSYAAVYSHKSDSIEIRDRTQLGNILHSITNATSLAQLSTIFKQL